MSTIAAAAELEEDRLHPPHHVERGAVALGARGETVEVKTAWVQALGRDTIFRITSMTKPITAVTRILVEEERIALGDNVERWLPALASRRVLRGRAALSTRSPPTGRSRSTIC
jgi:CubicO group peptidase (beta-lactamase class C family)